MGHQIELGNESLHGEISNNPLYQLADEHHLIEIDESKHAHTRLLFNQK